MPRFSRPPFQSSTVLDQDSTRVVLHGELDLATTPLLVRELEQAERGDPRLLVLDLAGVTFVDVAGLTAMLAAARRASAGGRRVLVSGARAPIRRLFELTAIDQTLEVASEPVQ